MATSKTLTPTNVTISIPEMTDSPDASVFSNCVDKEADAINSLNSKIIFEEIPSVAPDEAISAGTPGTRGAQKIIPYNCPTGYTPSSVIVTYTNDSNVVHPFAFFSRTNLYVNWYRAVATAIDTGSATINLRLTYVKS